MANKTAAGFGDVGTNGTYVEGGTENGYAVYRKSDNYLMIYYSQFMPYSYSAGYYIIKITRIPGGSITQAIPYYKVEGTSPTASGWISLRPKDSGEEQVGIVT